MQFSLIALALSASAFAAPVARRQDTNAVGDVLDNAVTGLQDGFQGAGSQVEGITDQLLDTDNMDSAISTVSGNSLENLKGSLADLGLGGS
jgi:hypothetical protein